MFVDLPFRARFFRPRSCFCTQVFDVLGPCLCDCDGFAMRFRFPGRVGSALLGGVFTRVDPAINGVGWPRVISKPAGVGYDIGTVVEPERCEIAADFQIAGKGGNVKVAQQECGDGRGVQIVEDF